LIAGREAGWHNRVDLRQSSIAKRKALIPVNPISIIDAPAQVTIGGASAQGSPRRGILDHRDDRHPHQCISTSGTDRGMSSAGSYQFTAVAAFIGLAQKQRLHDVRAHRSRDPGHRRYGSRPVAVLL
jgi:hypothetical protein